MTDFIAGHHRQELASQVADIVLKPRGGFIGDQNLPRAPGEIVHNLHKSKLLPPAMALELLHDSHTCVGEPPATFNFDVGAPLGLLTEEGKPYVSEYNINHVTTAYKKFIEERFQHLTPEEEDVLADFYTKNNLKPLQETIPEQSPEILGQIYLNIIRNCFTKSDNPPPEQEMALELSGALSALFTGTINTPYQTWQIPGYISLREAFEKNGYGSMLEKHGANITKILIHSAHETMKMYDAAYGRPLNKMKELFITNSARQPFGIVFQGDNLKPLEDFITDDFMKRFYIQAAALSAETFGYKTIGNVLPYAKGESAFHHRTDLEPMRIEEGQFPFIDRMAANPN